LVNLPVFALVFFRVSGLVMTAPLLSSPVLPRRLKIAITLTLAVLLFPPLATQAPAELTLAAIVPGAVGELAIGAAIGLGATILVMGAELAGLLAGQQAGLALGQVFNPALETETTILGQLYAIVLTFVFLVVGGHRAMIAALFDTFEVIPLFTARPDETFVVLLVELLSAGFIFALRLAAPVLIALFLETVVMAFLSRTMPQLNILSVGFNARVLMGLAVAGLGIAACQDLLVSSLRDGMETIRGLFEPV
jgi:flagellar biosynthetic protein FliR